MAIRLIQTNDYVTLFGISLKTAATWIARDRKAKGLTKLTIGHICEIYALTPDEVNAELSPKKR